LFREFEDYRDNFTGTRARAIYAGEITYKLAEATKVLFTDKILKVEAPTERYPENTAFFIPL